MAPGTGPGVIQHADGSPVTTDSPALPGEAITAYVTGLGTTDNIMVDGAAAVFAAQGSVTIGGTPTAGSTGDDLSYKAFPTLTQPSAAIVWTRSPRIWPTSSTPAILMSPQRPTSPMT